MELLTWELFSIIERILNFKQDKFARMGCLSWVWLLMDEHGWRGENLWKYLLSVFPLYANLHVQGQLSLGICTAYLVCILKLLTFGLIGILVYTVCNNCGMNLTQVLNLFPFLSRIWEGHVQAKEREASNGARGLSLVCIRYVSPAAVPRHEFWMD